MRNQMRNGKICDAWADNVLSSILISHPCFIFSMGSVATSVPACIPSRRLWICFYATGLHKAGR
jgi:hypothetical protein